MKKYRLNNMKRGWFIGEFEPTVLCFSKGEIAIKKMRKGKWIYSYYHPDAILIITVLQGTVCCSKRRVTDRGCMIFNAGEVVCLYALEDSLLLYSVYGNTDYSRDEIMDWGAVAETYEAIFSKYTSGFRYDELSVLVQGAIDRDITPATIKQVRSLFVGSIIILSTWEGQDTSGLDYDILVKSKDPGGVVNQVVDEFDFEYTNNVNRQLVSTREGLKEVKTNFVLKIRTDMIPTTTGFIDMFDKFPASTDDVRIFSHKVLISDLYTRHYFAPDKKNYFPMLFHPSDWFFFGFTEDLRKYFFSIDLIPINEIGNYRSLINPEMKSVYSCQWNARFVPEQFLAVNALKKYCSNVQIEDWTDITKENMVQSELFILNNFIPLDFDNHGMLLPKYYDYIFWNTGGNGYCIKGLYSYEIYSKVYNYIFAEANEPFYSEKWDINSFYSPFSALMLHNSHMMEKLRKGKEKRVLCQDIKKIDSKSVSVVVQGYIDASTRESHMVFDSIREFFPNAEVILSTWEGCNVDSLDYDKCVFSKDPGGIPCGIWDSRMMLNNYNRQIISTKAGLDLTSRPYVLKMRSDMVIMGDGILECFGYEKGRINEYSVFSKRLLIGELFTRKRYYYKINNREYSIPTPFHPSDWFVFGCKDDILLYYNSLHVISKEEGGEYKVIDKELREDICYPFGWKYPPEQQICVGFVKKFFPQVNFDDWTCVSDKLVQFSRDFLFSNYMILNYAQNQLLELKHDTWIYDNSGYSYKEKGLLTNDEEMKWIEMQSTE